MGACWLHRRELTAARLQLLTDSLDLLNLFTAEQETMESSVVNIDTSFAVKPDRASLLMRISVTIVLQNLKHVPLCFDDQNFTQLPL